MRNISNIQTEKGCTRITVVDTEEHKLRNIRKRICWTPRKRLGSIKDKTFQSRPTFAHTNNMELVQVFKRIKNMHPIIPLGKHALNMLQKIREWCTSKCRISFTRKNCNLITVTYSTNAPKRIASYISLNIRSRQNKQHQVRKYNCEKFMRCIIIRTTKWL